MVRMTWVAKNTTYPSELIMLAERGDADTQREVLARSDCPAEAVAAIAWRAAEDRDLRTAAAVLRRDPEYPARDLHFLGYIGAAMAFAPRQGQSGACPPEDWDLLWSCPDLAKIAGKLGGRQ